ncbi:unnamed protein product (macronuclear) [Paramecium tetraurelia]|uniref:Protein kinase domain-containing protein n=1 Tax=Paramecium tetraurelia TaxID=5888 RepID=A0EFC2_PARTE|nr:uncharacterized protein GSPATT00026336001 [Paramecium tetraurelia]CAK94013.1 unnamed protein product [Paramecium tetraurelia]|eukprot:XP_001461386.1 hypothetical protein (macronuclear) [Paramecium tetraurelia strain d4-2]
MSDTLEIRDNYIIKYSESNKIGMGAFGEVYKCRRKDGSDDDDSLCVKLVQKDKAIMKQQQQGLTIQKLLINLKPERLVRIENYLNLPHQFEIIMERCDMDLEKEFQSLLRQKQWYNLDQCLNIVHQIAEGCRILYEHNIVHRDIKPSNILVKVENKKQINERKVYKITDFDFSKILEAFHQPNALITNVGTATHSSPQITFNNSGKGYSGKCDIYSYGTLFYQVFFEGKLPNTQIKQQRQQSCKDNELENIRLFQKAIQTQKFKCNPPKYDRAQEIADLLDKMIVYEEEERISFDQFFLHPIVNLEEYEIFKIQTVQFRKQQFYNSIWKKYQNQNDINTITFILCLQQLGYQELLYCMGFIHSIITDIHPSYKLKKDITTIQRILSQCAKDINFYPMYQKQTMEIRKEYFQMKEILNQQELTFLQLKQKISPDDQQIQPQMVLPLQEGKRIEPQLIFDTLRSLLDQNLYEDLKSEIRKVLQFQEKYPYEKYREVNPDEIFKMDISV